MKQLAYVLGNEKEVLGFLKSHFPVYHDSNIFFRDIQYGLRTLLERKGMKTGYAESETVARAFVRSLVEKNILLPVDGQTWVVHYPEYKKPQMKAPAPPARPAPPRMAAPVPAAAAVPAAESPKGGERSDEKRDDKHNAAMITG